ncbi:MAG: hypothetical protein HYS26_00595 [Candidatus Kaiserbacteria bacterium]|nr:MAG: hypothetical protein HYS26_00595 [Candidatus Kaiserbacteria bacterium]
MDSKQLAYLYSRLVEYQERNDEIGAGKYLAAHFHEFPKELQGELLTHFYINALNKKVEHLQVVQQVQEEGLELYQSLEIVKKLLQETGGK